jgi:2-(1,2-epoxy-1,2-dihydrophenyl)acetyl-CoA isomerase
MRDYPEDVEGIEVIHRDGVVSVVLDRPERRNAITDEMVFSLIDLIEVAGSDESVRVIHLSGRGDHFCSGFDLSLRGGGDPKPRAGATQRRMRWHVNRLIPSMLVTQTPIVTSVKGWAIGLGMSLALASDFVVAADDAQFWLPFTSSGLTPDSGASWLVPRLVGAARAKEMILLAEKITGARAAEWGLIYRAVPKDEVEESVAELIDKLAGSATVAVGLAKLLIQRSRTVDLARHLEDEGFAIELSSRSEDFREAGRARREGRDAEFEGR